MAIPRIFGTETEYGYTLLHPARAVERRDVLLYMNKKAPELAPSASASDGRGIFLASGGRWYLDWTASADKPEFATAECSHPNGLLRSVKDGDAFMERLGAEVEREFGGEMLFSKTNVDYLSGNTWGGHESYMIRRGCEFVRGLTPFLASRMVVCGSGGFDSGGCGTEYVLSSRVPHIKLLTGYDTQHDRPLINTRDESHGRAKDQRIHLILGEGLMGDTSNFLRAATTAMVVGLIEAGVKPEKGAELKDPLEAMRAYARDVRCEVTAESRRGRGLRAIDVQRHYLGKARENLEKLPVWAADACRLWGEVLEGLETGREQETPRLDWVIRRHFLGSYLRRRGLGWEDLEQGREMTGFGEIRAELQELDTRFGQVGARGIFAELDGRGLLRHRIEESDYADEPATTRARLRGAAIREACRNGSAGKMSVEWTHVMDYDGGRMYDLADPWGEDAAWVQGDPEAGRRKWRFLERFERQGLR